MSIESFHNPSQQEHDHVEEIESTPIEQIQQQPSQQDKKVQRSRIAKMFLASLLSMGAIAEAGDKKAPPSTQPGTSQKDRFDRASDKIDQKFEEKVQLKEEGVEILKMKGVTAEVEDVTALKTAQGKLIEITIGTKVYSITEKDRSDLQDFKKNFSDETPKHTENKPAATTQPEKTTAPTESKINTEEINKF